MSLRPARKLSWAALVAALAMTVSACSGGDGATETRPDAPTGGASSAPASTPGTPSPSPSPSAEESAEESAPPRKTPLGMRVGPTFFGMHDGRVSQGIAPDAPVGSLRFWDSGTSWLHLETSPGQFSWGPLDTAVATAQRVGARPLLVMGQTPTFHASRPREEAAYGPGAASMPDLGAWRRYVAAVAERYGNRIDYQIWNEGNIIGYWTGTPRQLARLTIEASRVIRDRVPDATVVAPAFALRLPYQQEYFKQFWSLPSRGVDVDDAVDAVSVHLYPPAEGSPEAQIGLLEEARRVLSEHEVDRPVWNTEINFGLMGGPEPPPIPAERQRAFLVRAYLVNAGLGVERVYWYSWNIGRIANTYVTEEDLTTETLAGRSFDVVRAWLGGTRIESCTAKGPKPGVWECVARSGAEHRTFWWKPRGGAVEVAATDARSWTTVEGRRTTCRGTCRIRVGETPVMVVSRR